MKHKITNIEEPVNDIELQKVKDAKEFSDTLVKLVASTSAAMVGPTTLIGLGGSNSDFSAVASTLGVLLLVFCGGIVNSKLINHLYELYNRKGNISNIVVVPNGKQEIENELSGGMKK